MKQTEMSKYLKLITAGTGILFLALVAWVFALGTEAGAGRTGGKRCVLGNLYLHLDNSDSLFPMFGQILGRMQQDRREQVFLPGKRRGA